MPIDKLQLRLIHFKERFKKEDYFIQLHEDKVRIGFKGPDGKAVGLTNYMTANELIIWLEGAIFGANAADFEPFDIVPKWEGETVVVETTTEKGFTPEQVEKLSIRNYNFDASPCSMPTIRNLR
jgi:hypothetical protein